MITRRFEAGAIALHKLLSSTIGFAVAEVSSDSAADTACPEAGAVVSGQIVCVPKPVAEGWTITPGKLV